MQDFRTSQAAFNTSSGDQWDGFATHRRLVSDLLSSASGSTRLCVLGAGNANDLDLPRLLNAHREVHLVDIDGEALQRGVARQGLADSRSLHRHGGVDLTCLLDASTGWNPLTSIHAADLSAMVDWPGRRVKLALPGPFDVVASTCLLSQLLGLAYSSLGDRHPRFVEVVQALRLGHLRLLAELVRPGGEVVLITDVISSERWPELETLPDSSLATLVPRMIQDRGLIHGVNPSELLAIAQQDPLISAKVEVLTPWRWRLHARTYLVWAMRWRRIGR